MPDDFLNYRGYQVRVHDNEDGTFTAFYAPLDPHGQLVAEERATAPSAEAATAANVAKLIIDQEVR